VKSLPSLARSYS